MQTLEHFARMLADYWVLLGVAAVLTAVFGGVTTGFGAVSGAAIKAWFANRRQKVEAELATAKVHNEIGLSQDKQALEIFKQVVESMMPRVAALEREVRDLTQKEADCREQNAALRVEVKALRADNAALRAELAEIKGDLRLARASAEGDFGKEVSHGDGSARLAVTGP